VFTIRVPPLRELGADKILLLDHFRNFYAQQAKRQPFQLDQDAIKIWNDYIFPGNTRELRNIIIRLATKFPGQIVNTRELEAELDLQNADVAFGKTAGTIQIELQQTLRHGNFNLDDLLMEYTDRYISTAMEMAHGNVSEASKLLGIARTTLYSRMDALQKHKMQKMQ
jgi:DNA-binding NtrC family response regulator